ncbi:MAG: SCO family protein [Hyphomicrobiales bacterium]|nr:SCO family protein [Hyphomicrobiales bacterium]
MSPISRLLSVLVAMLVAAPLICGPVRAETKIISAEPEAAAKTDGPRRFLLTDTKGQAVTDQHFLGRYLLVYFGYTYCPDVCPTSLLTVSEVMKTLGDKASSVTPIFVSVDPDRDTPEVLADYVSAFDERIVALTGPKAYVDAAVAAYNAYYKIVPNSDSPDDYSVDHTASLAFVAPDGRLITRFGYGQSAEAIVERIEAVMEADAKVN